MIDTVARSVVHFPTENDFCPTASGGQYPCMSVTVEMNEHRSAPANRTCIRNAKVVLPDRIAEGCPILLEGGRITAVGVQAATADCRTIDAGGLYVSPGFVDIHVHGGGGHDFMDGTVEAFLGVAEAHLRHGTTTLLPTTLASDDDELFPLFSVFRQARAMNGKCANMPGMHLEGPYFSMEQRGAQDPKWIRNPAPAHYQPILEAGDGCILRWSSAPELEGAVELAAELRRRKILPSIAHTDAFFEQIETAMGQGFTHMTHLYSGMSGLRRIDGMRRAGAVESAYILDGLTVEIIVDGIHLPGPLLRQVYKNIGPARTALVTDAMRAAGVDCTQSMMGSLKKGTMVLVDGGVAWLPDRTAFAGSVATMDRVVRTMMGETGATLLDAVRMAADTPARIMGLATKGRIEPGMDADLVLFDSGIQIKGVILGGELLFG